MGLLFVLVFWAFVLVIVSAVLGIPMLMIANIYQKRTGANVRYWAWLSTPTALLFLFAGLFLMENIAYGILTDTDPGIGDYECVNINGRYTLSRIDGMSWSLKEKTPSESKACAFSGIEEILEQNDKLTFTSRINGGNSKGTLYTLTTLNTTNSEDETIDTAKTTDILWSKYTHINNIDKHDVCTCDAFYWESRQCFFYGAIAFNLIILSIFVLKYWKLVLQKKAKL